MIKIRKPKEIPEVNDKSGISKLTAETTKNNNLYDADSSKYDSGNNKFNFDNSIYGHENIKTALRNCQFGKCAFCEQNIVAVAYGDIEHFRPKKGYKQNTRDSLHYAGYYWLAYNWDNLVFSCAICNQRYKANFFPLLNPHLRAKNHHENIHHEKPFFINPVAENPKHLIRFDGPLAIGIDKRHRGKKTIESIGLNRKGENGISDLYEERLDYYEKIKEIYEISLMSSGSQISQDKIDRCKRLFKNSLSKKKKFFAMVRDNFPI